MFDVVLYQPEIPANTGNLIRLCTNTGCSLHLVKPLGFSLSDRALRRAGLDYSMVTDIRQHHDWNACLQYFVDRRFFAYTTRAARLYAEPAYQRGDVLVFGPETRGLPEEVLQSIAEACRLRLPMRPGNRSANLANTVAVVVYEAWRQLGFDGGS